MRLVGEGREAEIFEWDDGKVLRLLRDPTETVAAQRFAVGLAAAWGSGAPAPRPYEEVGLDGRPGLVMERAAGRSMLTLLGRVPVAVVWSGWTLGRIHARIHEVHAPPELPETRSDLRERIGRAPDALPPKLAARALGVLEDLPGGDRLCHGDYHPGNVLMSRGKRAVIDWTLASRGDPDADVARTLMTLRIGEPPPDVNVVIRVGATFARPLLVGGYLLAYRRRRRFDRKAVDRWMVVQAAARFAEGIESEYPALERLIASRM
jgi:aminoglycoside phosphotransferase (APT) family kinase protein